MTLHDRLVEILENLADKQLRATIKAVDKKGLMKTDWSDIDKEGGHLDFEVIASAIEKELKVDEEKVKISRIWTMPNKWTFTIKPIKELLNRYVGSGQGWVDPFAGFNSPAFLTNDIDRQSPASEHKDALEFLKLRSNNFALGGLYDPPYSITQARAYGKKEYSSMKYWADCKNELARIIKPGGLAICFGWNSMGLGKTRGFEMLEILLVAHGGSKNDTIITVERKLAHAISTTEGIIG
jgi:hypothetical protein